jgi:ribonuclease HI
MSELISHVTSVETNGGAVLEALLRDKLAAAPMTPEVERNDLIAVAVWYIWWERRKATHGEAVQSPARTAQSISTLALNYSRAKKRMTGIDRHGWVKPKENFVKLNVDAGFNADAGTGSTGAILRDDSGAFLAASCCGIPFISDPSSAEARALRDGLILAGQIGCNRIEVNSDCMDVIEVMNQGGNSFGPAAAIYEECSMLCHSFVEVVFSHCPREANMAAHALARSSEGPESIVWLDDPPDFIFSVLANDVTIM